MTRIESRPAKTKKWEYLFFVDLEGHKKDTIIQDTISQMKNLCLYLKILGAYPRVDEEPRSLYKV